jgi:hypothetical protein
VYHQLAQTHNTPIRQTMAHSLHEIALILGDSHLVEEELLSVFESMLQVCNSSAVFLIVSGVYMCVS